MLINILLGTAAELDALPADVVYRAAVVIAHNAAYELPFECIKDRRGTVCVGARYATAAAALGAIAP